MALLPTRPLGVSFVYLVRAAFKIGALALLLVGTAALVVVFLGGEVLEIRQHSDIWDHGRPALSANMSGKVTSHNFMLHDYKLTVRFVDADNQQHSRSMNFSTLFRKLDRDLPIEVHYDPTDPDHRFAVNAVEERSGSRYLLLFAGLLLAGTMGYGFFVGIRRAYRDLVLVRRVAKASSESVYRIVDVTKMVDKRGRPTGAVIFRYQIPGVPVPSSITFKKGTSPLFSDDSKQSLVALVAAEPPHLVVVVRSDRYPFAG